MAYKTCCYFNQRLTHLGKTQKDDTLDTDLARIEWQKVDTGRLKNEYVNCYLVVQLQVHLWRFTFQSADGFLERAPKDKQHYSLTCVWEAVDHKGHNEKFYFPCYFFSFNLPVKLKRN